MNATLIIVIIVVIVALAVLAGLRLGRTRRLRTRGGPEYDRVAAGAPSRAEAENRLLDRERRHDELDLRPLTDAARVRYANAWTTVQERFVDTPARSVREADALITELMRERGYPVENFAQRLADLSVDHAHTLEHYRAAREITARIAEAPAEDTLTGEPTEEMRQAMVRYRELFTALLDDGAPHGTDRGAGDHATPVTTVHDRPAPPLPRQERRTPGTAGPPAETTPTAAKPGPQPHVTAAPYAPAGREPATARMGRRLRDALRPGRGGPADEADPAAGHAGPRDAGTEDRPS